VLAALMEITGESIKLIFKLKTFDIFLMFLVRLIKNYIKIYEVKKIKLIKQNMLKIINMEYMIILIFHKLHPLMYQF
jgi:hypothetical protein